jgi:uncharacterized YccA/Bax inhibitor family protein
MSTFKTGNPTLTEKIFDKSLHETAGSFGVMSIRGTMNKFGFLLLMVMASAMFIWNIYAEGNFQTATTLMLVGAIGGFILALVIMFKPTWAAYIVPAYGILEGLFIGGISAFFNQMFAKSYPNLIIHAVGLTMGVALAMFLLYNFRIITVTNKFRSIIMSATMGIGLFYLIVWILGLFGVDMGFAFDSSPLSIGISLFIVGIAAMNLLLDFDAIEQAAEMGAPKYMEWYGAFGLLVTLVWLYLEILKLLSKLNSLFSSQVNSIDSHILCKNSCRSPLILIV